MRSQPRFSRTIALGFAAFALAFVCSTLGATWIGNSIGNETDMLATTALPSIDHLAAASDALRDLEAHADDFPDVPREQRAAARAAIDEDWRKLDSQLTAYLALPLFDGERESYDANVPGALREVIVALTHLFSQVEAEDIATARRTADREVRAAANGAAHRLRALIRFNATHAREGVDRIESTHKNAERGALVLDGLTILLGLALTGWTLRRFNEHDRLAKEHALLVQQRADELEVFGKRVAHDLLSPLSALTYCLSAFKRPAEHDPKLQDALGRARACVQRAQTMVSGIFEFARAGGRPERGARADLHDVLEQVSAEVCAGAPRGEPPEVRIEPFDAPLVACSPGVLSCILNNLMTNAVKYMSDSAEKRISVRVSDVGEAIRVEIEDTGPGVRKAIEDSLFEPYVRAEGLTQPGLGLGLATVQRLCVAHGGDVGFRSTEGHGSIFWFTLPKFAPALESKPASVETGVRRIR